jgi:lactobin A/cerein 7B family class IIb bacteriocin
MNSKTINPAITLAGYQKETNSSAPLFEKRTIVELSDSELSDVNGGSTPALAASSTYCASAAVAVTAFVATAIVGYF